MYPRLHKLVWSEGMYLAPQHFQAQARFFENTVHFLADCFWQYNYGFTGLEIDENELRRGTFVLHHLRGVMPATGGTKGEPANGHGLSFDISQKDDLPPARSVADLFPSDGRPLMLFLSIQTWREDRACVPGQNTGAAKTRFTPARVQITDLNTGQDLKAVKLLKPNLRIVTENECDEFDAVMPIARILRDGKGHYVADTGYAPPSLRVVASPRLQFLMDRLLDILSEKSKNLTARRRGGSATEMRGDPREMVEFWLLHSVNAAIPGLQMWKKGRSPHPAQLYRDLARLAGSLCTFVSGSEPAGLPEYDHLALGDCFGALDEHIQRHLEVNLPTNCLTIPLEGFMPSLGTAANSASAQNVDNSLFLSGEVTDPRCFGPAKWVLSVKAAVPESVLVSQTPNLVKVSSRDLIGRLVANALPGVPLTYLPVPPTSVPARPDEAHFSIDKNHPYFDAINHFKNIGIAIPVILTGADARLHIVLDKP